MRGWPRMRRWADLSQVERVDLYTRQSLYLFIWFFNVLAVAAAHGESAGHRGAYVAGAVAAVALSALATRTMRAVFELHPAPGPLPWRSILPLLAVAALTVAAALPQATPVRGMLVLVVFFSVTWSLAGLRDPRAVAVLIVAMGVLMGATTGEAPYYAGGAAMAAFFVFTVWASLWMSGVVRELDTARSAQAALAVAEERLRFSRDVHDVLGRRLSTIAVQAELAARLAERGDARAGERMLEVRGVAHEALREARELARGYRATDLEQELEGARSLLGSAGIEVRLAVADVPERWQEPAAWVVREAVTNVLRHSSATLVTIAYDAPRITVENDGVAGSAPGAPAGSGIDGLRERLAPLGATLAASAGDGCFRLTALLPLEAGDLEPIAMTGDAR